MRSCTKQFLGMDLRSPPAANSERSAQHVKLENCERWVGGVHAGDQICFSHLTSRFCQIRMELPLSRSLAMLPCRSFHRQPQGDGFSTKGASISSHRQTKETLIEVWRSVIDLVFQHEVACDRHVWHQQLDSQRAHSGRGTKFAKLMLFPERLGLGSGWYICKCFFFFACPFPKHTSLRPFLRERQ